MNLLEHGVYKQAIECFEKTLKLMPDLAEAHYNLAMAYAESKDYDKAVKEYIKTIGLKPDYIKARFNLALIYYDELQMYEEAAKELQEILKLAPDYTKAKELLDRISLDYSATALNSGLDFLGQDKFKEAEGQFNKVLAIKPDFASAKYNLALLYLKEGNADAAKVKLEEIIKEEPSYVFAHRQLASIYFDENNFTQAEKYYQEVISLKPNDIQAHNDLAQAYTKLGDYAKAIREFQSALLIEPANLNVLYSLAATYRDKGDYQEAIFYYRKLQALSPDYPFVHTELAGIYGELGMDAEKNKELPGAINEYKTRLITEPSDVVSLGHLAEAYLQMGEINLAKETVEKIFEINKDYLPAYITYGYILDRLGDKEGALRCFEKAKEAPGLSSLAGKNIESIKGSMPEEDKDKGNLTIIYLKNGRKLEGKILKETSAELALGVMVGQTRGTLTISKKEIEKIERGKE